MRLVGVVLLALGAGCAPRGPAPPEAPTGSRGEPPPAPTSGLDDAALNEVMIGKLLEGLDAAPHLTAAGDAVVRCATEGTGRRADPYEVWCHVASVGDGAARKFAVLAKGEVAELDFAAKAPSARAQAARAKLEAAAVEVERTLGRDKRRMATNCKTNGGAPANCAFGTEIAVDASGKLRVTAAGKVILTSTIAPRRQGASKCDDQIHVEAWADGPSRVLAIAFHRFNKVAGCALPSTSELRAVTVP